MEGIVLKMLPYQERKRIITVFTKELGLITVLVKNIAPKSHGIQNSTSPLALSEFQLKKGRGEMYEYHDGSLIDPFLEIRGDFDKLEGAGLMLKSILKTQYPEKPAPLLFLLLRGFLEKIKTSQSVEPFVLGFYMRLLKHEGVLPYEMEGLSFTFDEEEKKCLENLLVVKTFTEIEQGVYSKPLVKKIYRLFEELTD